MAATLDLSKLSLQELRDLPTSDGPKPTQPAQIDTGLNPNHNVVDMFDGSDIKQPDQTGSLSQEEVAKTAQYRAQQAAYSLQQAGTPLNREQYKRLVLDQYEQVFKLNVPRTPEELAKLQQEQLGNIKAQQDIGILPQKAKQLDATQALDLSAAQSSFESLDQLAAAHSENVQNHRPGFGKPGIGGEGGALGNADWTPQGAAYVALSEGSLPLFAKGISNVIGNPSESDMKSVRAMQINPGDSLETVAQKVKIFKEKIVIGQRAKIAALGTAGYDVSGMKAQLDKLESLIHPPTVPADTAADQNLSQHTDNKLTALTTPKKLAQGVTPPPIDLPSRIPSLPSDAAMRGAPVQEDISPEELNRRLNQ